MANPTSNQVFHVLCRRAGKIGYYSHGHPLCNLILGREVFLCERHYTPSGWITRIVCVPPEDILNYVGEEDARVIRSKFPTFSDQFTINGDNYPQPEGFGPPVRIELELEPAPRAK
ncbi:MAG: hypothetical protein WC693_05875 [Patescibacteria group bacterium]